MRCFHLYALGWLPSQAGGIRIGGGFLTSLKLGEHDRQCGAVEPPVTRHRVELGKRFIQGQLKSDC